MLARRLMISCALVAALVAPRAAMAAEVVFKQAATRVKTARVTAPESYHRREDWTTGRAARKAAWRKLAATGKAVDPTGRLRRVLYPMARSDWASALKLVGGAAHPRELWLVDDSRFGSDALLGELATDAPSRQRYDSHRNGDVTATVDRYGRSGWPRGDEGTGAAILWDLDDLGAKNIVVTHLDDAGKPLGKRALGLLRAEERGGPRPPEFARAHARVDFTLGGVKQRIVFVQHRIGHEPMPALLSAMIGRGYDALIEKVPGNTSLAHADHRAFLEPALRGLRPGGVVLTDRLPDWRAARDAGALAFDEGTPLRYGSVGSYSEAGGLLHAVSAR